MLHAWYSEKQAQIAGTCFYSTADGKGEIEVSMVSDQNTPPKFDDVKYLGMVGKCLRQGRPCPMKDHTYLGFSK